jgi:Enoyl-CoA hydratase/isomerase
VLVAEFHSDGGPFTFTAQDHTEFVEAFYRIAQDRANKVVILTGAGGEFIPGIDFSSFGNVADPAVWSQVHDEGVQILENIDNIRVPVIAAVEGRAHVHSEYALLANVIVAGEDASFHDIRRSVEFGITHDGFKIDMSGVRDRKRDMVHGLNEMYLQNYRSTGAEFILGTGRFIAPRTVEISSPVGLVPRNASALPNRSAPGCRLFRKLSRNVLWGGSGVRTTPRISRARPRNRRCDRI